jgi:hypothetical protein
MTKEGRQCRFMMNFMSLFCHIREPFARRDGLINLQNRARIGDLSRFVSIILAFIN